MISVLLLVSMALLCGCGASHDAEPLILTSFTSRARIQYNDMELECWIERMDTSAIEVAIDQPESLQGLVVLCEGDRIQYQLDGMEYTVSSGEIDDYAFIIALSSVFNALTRTEEVNVKRTQDGFQYTGTCSQGNYTVEQNIDSTYKSLKINGILEVEFLEDTAQTTE